MHRLPRIVALLLIAGYAASAAIPCELLPAGPSAPETGAEMHAEANAGGAHAHHGQHAGQHPTAHGDHQAHATAPADPHAGHHGSGEAGAHGDIGAQCPCGCGGDRDASRHSSARVGYALTRSAPALGSFSSWLPFDGASPLLPAAPALGGVPVPI